MPSLLGPRRRQPVRATPAAISDASVFTAPARAAAELGGTVAGAGLALGDIQRRRNTELAKTDFTAMKADTLAARNEFLRGLRTTDDDYNTINQKWGEFKKKTFKTIGGTTKQRQAQRAYGSWAKGINPQWDQDIDNIAWGVSSERAKVKVFNSATETLRNAPDFDMALLTAGMDIERSNLLTSEEKDLALANAAIETNPQWYIDNVDAEGTKELFELLSADQKKSLNTKARESINRIRIDQQQAQVELNTDTRKTASELWRTNELSSDWLQLNRPNMAGSDYERYNFLLIGKAEAEKKFQANLAEIEDPFNREIFGKLDIARTPEELDALQTIVNDYVSPGQKKLNVDEAKKWSSDIEAKRGELVRTRAQSFTGWSSLMDRITQVQAGAAEVEVVRREIDRAVVPPEGQDATITPELAMSLRTRLEGIERNPAVKGRPSLARAHASLGRLRSLQAGLVTREDAQIPPLVAGQRGIDLDELEPDQAFIAIENSFTRMASDLDAYSDTIAGDKDFDAKINQKLQDLTRPIVEEQVLGFFNRTFRLSEETFLIGRGARFLGTSEEAKLARERIKTLEAQSVFGRFSAPQQDRARVLIESGSTVEEAITEVEGGVGGGTGGLTEEEQKRHEELRRKAGLQ